MKRLLAIVIILIAFAICAQAQDKIDNERNTITINAEPLFVNVPDMDYKPIEWDLLRISKPEGKPDPRVSAAVPNFIIHSEDPAFIYRFKFSDKEIDLTENELKELLTNSKAIELQQMKLAALAEQMQSLLDRIKELEKKPTISFEHPKGEMILTPNG